MDFAFDLELHCPLRLRRRRNSFPLGDWVHRVDGRTIAIGDIHGCAEALASLLRRVSPQTEDTIIQLGDVVDRGPDSRGVIDQLLRLSTSCRLIVLRGDHEEMLLDAANDCTKVSRWLRNGGIQTLASYGQSFSPDVCLASVIPPTHLAFLENTIDHFETTTHIFVHAGYVADIPMSKQPGLALRWRVCTRQTAELHSSGRTAIVGHSAQRSGDVLDLGFVKCIDTNCVRGGWLTALHVESGDVWQVDRVGRLR